MLNCPSHPERTDASAVRGFRARPGFSLTELMITAVMMSIVGLLLTTILLRQQKFHRAIESVVDTRARMRDIATIFPTDMRGVSTVENDVLAWGRDSLQFRAFTGTSILCEFVTTTQIGLPPKNLNNGNVLTAWINAPTKNDLAYVYNDSTAAGNADDSWNRFTISSVDSGTSGSWCASTLSPAYTTATDTGASHRRYRLTLSAAPNQTNTKRGAVIRLAREVRYSAYQASDSNWYVGYQTCTANASTTTPGTCTAREILAGPIKAITTDTSTTGLIFRYYNKAGTELSPVSADSIKKIARITVKIRTTSESIRQATATKVGSNFTGGDSLFFVIGIRNRV